VTVELYKTTEFFSLKFCSRSNHLQVEMFAFVKPSDSQAVLDVSSLTYVSLSLLSLDLFSIFTISSSSILNVNSMRVSVSIVDFLICLVKSLVHLLTENMI
jgi:hypothetical protein